MSMATPENESGEHPQAGPAVASTAPGHDHRETTICPSCRKARLRHVRVAECPSCGFRKVVPEDEPEA